MDAEEELIERWHGWQRAIEARDVEAAGGFLADDYALIIAQPAQAVSPRSQWLGLLPDYIVSRYEVHEQLVEIDGDIGVVLHRATMTATVRGADRSGIFVLTDVWRRSDGLWKVWRRYSTPLTAGAMPSSG